MLQRLAGEGVGLHQADATTGQGDALVALDAAVALGRLRVIQNSEPSPGMLSRPISPPICSIRRLEMTRPRPVPPACRVRELSAWEKGLEQHLPVFVGEADPGVLDADAQLGVVVGLFL